jgi:hypothetical protein
MIVTDLCGDACAFGPYDAASPGHGPGPNDRGMLQRSFGNCTSIVPIAEWN